MKKRISFVVVIVLVALAAMLLSSCERSASKTPVATPTLNLPVTTQAQPVIVADDLSEKATEEAAVTQAAEEEEVEVIEEEPTQAPEVTATPEPVVLEVTRPETYALQQGEWPICIARRFDLDLGNFFSLNGLSMNSRPGVGAVLKIPADGNWNVPNYGERALLNHPTSYTVKSGDTIYTVACYFGDVAPEQIAAKNSLTAPYTLSAGQELQIP